MKASLELEHEVGQALETRGWTLSVAESCTGGLVGHLVTQVPGSSAYFRGGIIAYADEAKRDLLGVGSETLERHGAVSQQTALEMARGALRQLKSDLAVSVTGIAGPSGGGPEKPVGLTWVGVASPQGERAEQFIFQGDRSENKRDAARAALRLVLEESQGHGT